MKSIINLSLASNLALHSLHILAKNEDGQVNLKRLSKELDCSIHHLSKVMQKLVQAKVLQSNRGPSGGFSILDCNVSFWQVLQIVEGEYSEKSCLLNREKCLFGRCIFGESLDKISVEIKEMLKKRKICDLL